MTAHTKTANQNGKIVFVEEEPVPKDFILPCEVNMTVGLATYRITIAKR